MSTLRSSGRLRDGIPRERTARRKYSRVDVRLKDASTREDRRSDRKRKEETCPRDAGSVCTCAVRDRESIFRARADRTGRDDTTRRGRRHDTTRHDVDDATQTHLPSGRRRAPTTSAGSKPSCHALSNEPRIVFRLFRTEKITTTGACSLVAHPCGRDTRMIYETIFLQHTWSRFRSQLRP